MWGIGYVENNDGLIDSLLFIFILIYFVCSIFGSGGKSLEFIMGNFVMSFIIFFIISSLGNIIFFIVRRRFIEILSNYDRKGMSS